MHYMVCNVVVNRIVSVLCEYSHREDSICAQQKIKKQKHFNHRMSNIIHHIISTQTTIYWQDQRIGVAGAGI